MKVAAWGALGIYVAITAIAVGVVLVQGASADSLGALGFAGFAVVGALIALRQPRNAVGWLLLVVAIMFAAVNAGEGWVEVGNPGRVAVAGPTSWGTNVWFSLGIIVLPLLLPDGRLPASRWRPRAGERARARGSRFTIPLPAAPPPRLISVRTA